MSMFVWPDDIVTGSVNVAELEEIQKGLKGLGKRKLAALPWPIESAEQLADALANTADDDEPEPPKAAKAQSSSKADPKADAEAAAAAQVDLPAILDKATGKKGN